MIIPIQYNLIEDAMKFEGKAHRHTTASMTVLGAIIGRQFGHDILRRVHGVIMVIVHDKMAFLVLGGLSRLLGLTATFGSDCCGGRGVYNGNDRENRTFLRYWWRITTSFTWLFRIDENQLRREKGDGLERSTKGGVRHTHRCGCLGCAGLVFYERFLGFSESFDRTTVVSISISVFRHVPET
jgi:hypothetical protein